MTLAILLCGLVAAHATWLIDPTSFHVSAHGQVSCQECHERIAEIGLHPSPVDVNKELRDFFHISQCSGCHGGALDDLDNGLHGREEVKQREAYAYCISCHNPHYQIRLMSPLDGFDSTKPPSEQCGACHEEREALPDLLPEDEECMVCHRSIEPEDPQGTERISRFCFHCHGQEASSRVATAMAPLPAIEVSEYRSSPHSTKVSCLVCHTGSARFRHRNQKLGECGQCHPRHDEKVAHDAHMRVSCEACHLQGIIPLQDPESGRILWQLVREPGVASKVHNLVRIRDESFCRSCHFAGNPVGAAALVLPPKSVICMPCHAATFSVSDTTTTVALVIFVLGTLSLVTVWLSGSFGGEKEMGIWTKLGKLISGAARSVFSYQLLSIIKVLILDALLQVRLYRQSRLRWIIHGLIFFPLAFRFLWGLVALTSSLWIPEWQGSWLMLDKNNPIAALLFDLSGTMIIIGVVLTLVRKAVERREKLAGLPGQDWLAVSLLAGIVTSGFILEGLRIVMTGHPTGAEHAFIGNAISFFFETAPGVTNIYGYVWYVHAAFTGAFVAYLPFSRMFHIFMAPVTLAINAALPPSRIYEERLLGNQKRRKRLSRKEKTHV